jgi:hypothetical protein
MDSRLIPTLLRQATAATALLALSGCHLLTDGATRLAYDVESASRTLRRSDAKELAFTHRPVAWPEGVTGPYEVVVGESPDSMASGSSLLVGDLNSRNYGLWGYNWSTSYHLNFVRVPRTLRIRKSAGAPLGVQLRKNGPHIEVISLQ